MKKKKIQCKNVPPEIRFDKPSNPDGDVGEKIRVKKRIYDTERMIIISISVELQPTIKSKYIKNIYWNKI